MLRFVRNYEDGSINGKDISFTVTKMGEFLPKIGEAADNEILSGFENTISFVDDSKLSKCDYDDLYS